MKRVFILFTAIIISAMSVSLSCAADLSRAEYGKAMIDVEWCTEDFNTQREFHKVIDSWNVCESASLESCNAYDLISGGNAWSEGHSSPEISTTIFLKTDIRDGEKVEDAKKRLFNVAKSATEFEIQNTPEHWWSAEDHVSLLLISM